MPLSRCSPGRGQRKGLLRRAWRSVGSQGRCPVGPPRLLRALFHQEPWRPAQRGGGEGGWTRALWAGKPGCSAAQGLAAFLQTEGIRRGVGGVHPEDRARGPRRQPRPGLVEAALLGRDLARLVLPPPRPGGSICNWQPAPALPGLDAGNFRLQRSRAGGQACCAVGWIEFQVSL